MSETPATDAEPGKPPAAEDAGPPSDALGTSAGRDISASERVAIASAADASAAAGSGDQPGKEAGSPKRFSAPQAPRWRFIESAKKTQGYSSFAAGSVVKGKEASELVGKYEPKLRPSEAHNVEHVQEQVAEIEHEPEDAKPKELRSVGKLKIREGGDTTEETFEGSFARKKGVDVDELVEGEDAKPDVKEAVDVEDQTSTTEWEEVKLGAKATPAVLAVEGQTAEEPAAVPDEEAEKASEEDQKKKKKRCLLLLLLLVIVAIVAIVLGVLLGGDKSDEDSSKAVDGGGIGSEEITTPTASPTSAFQVLVPPPRPGECPADETMFVLQRGLNPPENSQHTWTVKDACTGDVVLRCPTCDEVNSQSSSLFEEVATPAPTATSTLSFDEVCIGETTRPRPRRGSERFRFNLHVNSFGSGACIDSRGRRYEWLKISATDFGDCAERCVQGPPETLALSESFRGFDFNCAIKECRCLYDEGVLGGSDALDQVNSGEAVAGVGEISGVVTLANHFCGKRVQDRDLDTDAPTTSSPASAPQLLGTEIAASVNPNYFSGCLANDKEYVFEVEPIIRGGASCCGFVPESFVATYDDIVVVRGDWPEGKEEEEGGTVSLSFDELTTTFGTSSVPCPSPEALAVASTPSIVLTNKPTTQSPLPPSTNIVPPPDGGIYPCREVIEAEMAGLIIGLDCKFCGHCQWEGGPSFNCYQRVSFLYNTYQVGQLTARQNLCNQGWCQVPQGGVGPEVQAAIERASSCGPLPIANPSPTADPPPTDAPVQSPTAKPSTGMPTTSPARETGSIGATGSIGELALATTSSPSKRPTNEPSVGPTQSPVTPAPSTSPIGSPVAPLTSPPVRFITTESPTQNPTCIDDSVYQDFSLCFAIDMSGSVCNQGTGFFCEECDPPLICNEAGVVKENCCTNFLSLTEFAQLVVMSLGSLPVDQSYSVVGFGSGASVSLSLGSSDDALDALDDLVYTGGRTNHADAISACASTLRSNDGDTTDLILLITDSDPSLPEGAPQEAAEVAASEAKGEGMVIVPVVITEPNSTLSANQSYLQGISSDGKVFNVDGFGFLTDLQEDIVQHLSCQV
ncbi:hypothetical protein ACHAXT_012904 [Thalassiosira profunda]